MINEATIRKIVDYMLLNACSINSSGLYSGKAGIALTLFEVARYLQDEYIEEQAFDLLQESLTSKTENISFEHGLSGIGYVLLYLIENKFIEADFDELFTDQYNKIIEEVDKSEGNSVFLFQALRMNYFWTSVKSIYPKDKRIDEIIRHIFEANELYFSVQFFDFNDINYTYNKNAVLKRFETYLKTVYECDYTDYSHVILDDYAKLYRNNRIMSSYNTAYYMEKLDTFEKYKDVINENKLFSCLDSVESYILTEHIDSSKPARNYNSLFSLTINKENELEKILLKHIPPGAFVAGYGQGIGQLLTHAIKKHQSYYNGLH